MKLSEQERARQCTTWERLRVTMEGLTRKDLFESYHISHGRCHYMFHGVIAPVVKERLGRMPTTNEVILLINKGTKYVGARCTIDSNTGEFDGKVVTK